MSGHTVQQPIVRTHMTDLPLTGGCLCGGVRWEIDAPPRFATYCHCTHCQRRTGAAASAQVIVEPGSFRITLGEDLVRGYQPPGGAVKFFCTTCGSALCSGPPDPDVRAVRFGGFDSDPGVRPTIRAWVASAAAWEPIP